jgi:hypothetical protein
MASNPDKIAEDCMVILGNAHETSHGKDAVSWFTPSIKIGRRYIILRDADNNPYLVMIEVVPNG